MAFAPSQERELAQDVAQFFSDPLGFVNYVFPWGKENTRLADQEGPDTWQVDILTALGDKTIDAKQAIQLAVSSGHGIGKGHTPDTLVETPSGLKRWGALRVGDQLFGSDGAPTKITGQYHRPVQTIYRVGFDDGSAVEVDADHLWNVRGRNHRRSGTEGWETVSTRELIERGVKRKNGTALSRQWEIPVQGAAQFPKQELPLHPYLVGVWIGDGKRGEPVYSTPHAEVSRHLGALGHDVRHRADGITKYIARQGERLRSLSIVGLYSHERYVPDEYKYTDVEDRKELLRGLLDTDGECTRSGSVVFSTTSAALCDDVVWLARSLGYKATKQPPDKVAHPNGQHHRDCYRCTITAPIDERLFYIQAKENRRKPVQERYLKRWIDSIEPVGKDKSICVTVEAEDSLYQTTDFIVTHNTALVAWIILWFISTRPHPQIIVTANTKAQLTSKTWRELSKWHKQMLNAHWFEWSATKFYLREHPETWFASAIPWSANNSEAFAGAHEEHILVIYDEASAVDDIIWEVTEGAMTTPGAMWVCFGNPTRNSGRFYDCFNRLAHRWETRQIDSRTAKMADKAQIQTWVDDYGEDSDFVRVRVRGVFPRAASAQFIAGDVVDEAMLRKLEEKEYDFAPLVMGVDVARFGDDQTVFTFRRGAKVWPQVKFRGMDTMQVADRVVEYSARYEPDVVFVDGVGIGAGVVDRLRQLGVEVLDVQGAAKPDDDNQFLNKRAECWGRMKEWLRGAVEIPNERDLKASLTGLEYGYNTKMQIQLEKKSDMKKRGLNSPDEADSLALTFAHPVHNQQRKVDLAKLRGRNPDGSFRGVSRHQWRVL